MKPGAVNPSTIIYSSLSVVFRHFLTSLLTSDPRFLWVSDWTALNPAPAARGPSYRTMGSLVKGTGGSFRPSGRVMTSIPPGHLAV